MPDSIMQTERECYITGATQELHRHHIYQGARRRASEEWGCWVWLRGDWHNLASYGVHFNQDLDRKLKQECQERFEELYGHDTFIQVFGKNYREDI